MCEGMALHQKGRKCLYDKYLSISNAHDMVLKKNTRMEMQDNSGEKGGVMCEAVKASLQFVSAAMPLLSVKH